MPRITAPFTITAWDPAEDTPWSAGPPALGRVTIRKAYTGALDGQATVEMLTCVADPADMGRGAFYSAVEQFTGRIDGHEGTVVFTHAATVSTDDRAGDPVGAVAPGSGTGALAGIGGTLSVRQGPDGHTLTLDYTLP